LTYWTVGFAEVWGEEDIEERAGKALHSVREREDSDTLGLCRVLENNVRIHDETL